MMKSSTTMVSLILGYSLFASAQAHAIDKYIYSQSEGLVKVYECDMKSAADVSLRTLKGSGTVGLTGVSGKKPVVNAGSIVRVLSEKGDVSNVQIVGLNKDAKAGSNERAAVRLDKGNVSKSSLNDIKDLILQLGDKAPNEDIDDNKLAGSFLRVSIESEKYQIFNCGGKDYVAFDVFVAKSHDPIAQLAVRADETSLLKSMRTLSAEEAEAVASKDAAKPEVKPEAKPEPVKVEEQPKLDEIICTQEDGLAVRSDDLDDVLFYAEKGESVVRDIKAGKKVRTVEGQSRDYVFGRIEARDAGGWIAAQYIKDRKACEATGSISSQPSQPAQPTQPQVVKPVVIVDSSFNMLAPSCARQTVLVTAKATVKKIYGNRPNSGGYCATGVRQILVASKVGGVTGGIGNAIDYMSNLKSYGYIDTGIRDVTKAPAGSILVFNGPNTALYLKNGTMKRPYGNYVGHVAVKGDDGFYYTDGRTAEPAIGWSNDKNVSKMRNLVGVFVPGESLVKQWSGKCGNM